ncbi:MAG: VOC family protein [Chitinophagales bacterium]
MAIEPKSPGIHHIGLRCRDMEITKKFYRDIVGFPLVLDAPHLIVFVAGAAFIVFKPANPNHPEDTTFSPFNIGLDHVAMIMETEEELNRCAAGLERAGVENTGVKLDEGLKKKYVAFKDPDRIQWEFYMK